MGEPKGRGLRAAEVVIDEAWDLSADAVAQMPRTAGEPALVVPLIDDPDIDDHRPLLPAGPSGRGAMTSGEGPLDDVEREVLAFERLQWKYLGVKEGEIRRRWRWSLTRYYQVLDALLDRPEAEAHDGQLINRLRRLRDARRAQRTAGGR